MEARHSYTLLELGADIEAKCIMRRTSLHEAAQRGNGGVVKILLEFGADTEVKERLGRTALELAAENGHEGVVKLLKSTGSSK